MATAAATTPRHPALRRSRQATTTTSKGTPTVRMTAAHPRSSPAVTPQGTVSTRRHSRIAAATTRSVANSTSAMIMCSSWIWYASKSRGTASRVAPQPGRPYLRRRA